MQVINRRLKILNTFAKVILIKDTNRHYLSPARSYTRLYRKRRSEEHNPLVKLNPNIPYTLAFYPQHMMRDLPLLTWEEAEECLEAAQESGLKRVRLENTHLLR